MGNGAGWVLALAVACVYLGAVAGWRLLLERLIPEVRAVAGSGWPDYCLAFVVLIALIRAIQLHDSSDSGGRDAG